MRKQTNTLSPSSKGFQSPPAPVVPTGLSLEQLGICNAMQLECIGSIHHDVILTMYW
jgi:hypothetical protein